MLQCSSVALPGFFAVKGRATYLFGCTSTCLGVDTALNTIVDACDKISDTARAHRRAFVVEVMGRDCGYLAMTTGISAAADAVLFREGKKTDAELVEQVVRAVESAQARQAGRRYVLVIQSEGVKLELEGGRVRRARGFFDLYDAATQLGLLPQRGSFTETALLLLRGFGLRPRA